MKTRSMISRLAAFAAVAAVFASVFVAGSAEAIPAYRRRIPNGFDTHGESEGTCDGYCTTGAGDNETSCRGCVNCHNNRNGGCGDGTGAYPFFNPFGMAFSATHAWGAALRDEDSDGDGRTNGQEAFYFGATHADYTQQSSFYATAPGFAAAPGNLPSIQFKHTDECTLETSSASASTHPDNYTNCALASSTAFATGVTCSDNNTGTVSFPNPIRYFGFTCACASNYVGNGRRNVVGDLNQFGNDYNDTGANGCVFNECSVSTTCHEHQDAGNVCSKSGQNPYQCSCDTGWTLVAGPDCQDNNECGAGDNRCLNNTYPVNTCSNTPGDYDCACSAPTFQEVNGGTASEQCQDVNECTNGTNPCVTSGTGNSCGNNTGGNTCSCNAATFTTTTSGTRQFCTDRNECTALGGNTCQSLAPFNAINTCTNSSTGGNTCTCGAGFSPRTSGQQQFCDDQDECRSLAMGGTDPCKAISQPASNSCTNNTGGNDCTCGTGFTESSTGGSQFHTCVLVNECAGNPCQGGTCSERDPSPGNTCSCSSGFTLNGTTQQTCTDNNECADFNRCREDDFGGVGGNQCANSPAGAYSCTCVQGWQLQGSGQTLQCTDIDECTNGTNPCNEGQSTNSCTDIDGGVDCTCGTGWTETQSGIGNRFHACADTNECLQATRCRRDYAGGTVNSCSNSPVGSYVGSPGTELEFAL